MVKQRSMLKKYTKHGKKHTQVISIQIQIIAELIWLKQLKIKQIANPTNRLTIHISLIFILLIFVMFSKLESVAHKVNPRFATQNNAIKKMVWFRISSKFV